MAPRHSRWARRWEACIKAHPFSPQTLGCWAHPATQPGWAHTLFPGDVVNQASATITPVFQGVGPVEYDGMSLAGVNNGASVYANGINIDWHVLHASELGRPLATLNGPLNASLTVRQWGPGQLISVASGPDAYTLLTAQQGAVKSLQSQYGNLAEPVGEVRRIVDDVEPELAGAAPEQVGSVWRPPGLLGLRLAGLEYIGSPEDVGLSRYANRQTSADLHAISLGTFWAMDLPAAGSGFMVTPKGRAYLVPAGANELILGDPYQAFMDRVEQIREQIDEKFKPRW